MPELPEIETTMRGITASLLHQTILDVNVRQSRLRLPVTSNLSRLCSGKIIINISRRGKYLLLHFSEGHLLIHLGMSGHLRLTDTQRPIGKHDHIDLCLTNDLILRYNDPRRFGLWLYIPANPLSHPLLAHLGPEPLTHPFSGEYLYTLSRNKKQSIKSFIMNNKIVVGVGNIYAAESLFSARIHPMSAAGALSLEKMVDLAYHIKHVLHQAIEAGGTTLRDFYAADGKPGYFSQKLNVYGRQKKPCFTCNTPIESIEIAGRNSAFCPQCQTDSI